MIVGFTGTREGLSAGQHKALATFLSTIDIVEFHHGDCVGADAQAHDLVRKLKPAARIITHPGNSVGFSASKVADEYDKTRDNIERNRLIVDLCRVLIACPLGPEALRSGTWSTVRYARKVRRPLVIIGRQE
jgi:hypothetical protein